MSLVSSFLAQNVLKHLLGFGKVSYFLGYNAFDDFFPNYVMKPNPFCENKNCLKSQEIYKQKLILSPPQKVEEKKEEPVKHEDNLWGISLIEENDNGTDPTPSNHQSSSILNNPGITTKFEKSQNSQNEDPSLFVNLDPNLNLENLQNQFNQL